MEDLENEQDRIGYWIVFFVIVVVVAVVGYFVVFYNDDKDSSKKEEEVVDSEEEDKLTEYVGVWAMFTDDEDVPDSELCINVVDGSTLIFDYFIKDTVYFESGSAHIENNTATFEIEDEEKEVTLDGKMVFRNGKIFLILSSSSDDELPLGTFEYTEKVDDSVLYQKAGE